MPIQTYSQASSKLSLLISSLKGQKVSHGGVKDDSCPFYDKPAKGEYFLITLYLSDPKASGYTFTIKGGKANHSTSTYPPGWTTSQQIKFDNGASRFIDAIELWLKNN